MQSHILPTGTTNVTTPSLSTCTEGVEGEYTCVTLYERTVACGAAGNWGCMVPIVVRIIFSN